MWKEELKLPQWKTGWTELQDSSFPILVLGNLSASAREQAEPRHEGHHDVADEHVVNKLVELN